MQMNVEMPNEFQNELRNSVTQIVTEAMKGVTPVKEIPEYLGKGQVCDYLNISRVTLDSWIKKGKAPRYTLIGGLYRFKRTEVDRFMLENSK